MKYKIKCNLQKSNRMKYGVNIIKHLVNFLGGFNHCRKNIN